MTAPDTPSNPDDAPFVLREDRDQVAWLTLNRPNKLNALSEGMIDAVGRTLDALAEDTAIRTVVIGGAGKAFSAGHDLKEMMSQPEQAPCEALFNACARMMLKIHHMPQPVIAMVDGIATAAGCQLVAQCDLAIASDRSKFATSGINLGLFCATPSVPLSRAIGRKAAAEMLFTGKFISATEAERLGLLNRAVGADVLEAEVENLALEIASKSPSAIEFGKRLLHAQIDRPLEDAYAIAAETMATNMQHADARHGIRAFIDKQPLPQWKDRDA